MQDSPFKIYNASAGSGKTYTLARSFLILVLRNPSNFKRILAITFTNKAVNEMKNRILDNLYAFSQVKEIEQAGPLFKDVMDGLDWDYETLKKTSKSRLKEILHNYSFFDTSTIDKFNHRIIRTFAIDLKLSQNFEVVLDKDLLLEEAVANLLAKAGEDKTLTELLVNFVYDKIDDTGNWDISYDLIQFGRLLFNENNITHLKKLSAKKTSDFIRLKTALKESVAHLEKQALSISKETLNYLMEQGLEPDDFPRQTLPNHFKKIIGGEFGPNALYKNQLGKNLEEGNIFKASCKIGNETITAKLLWFYTQLKSTIYKRALHINILKNVDPLTLLNTLNNELKQLQKEKDQLSISEFNTIISNEIKDQPAPFIYERLGEKYRYYFIDEFQDTSELQWGNLIPLIANALESLDEQGKTGSLFLVGDAKQAIYRWRGGKAEQFLDLATGAVSPFTVAANSYILPKNYRSDDQIVNFNNDFFYTISQLLDNSSYRSFFEKGSKQQSNQQAGGFVKLSFVDPQLDDEYENETLAAIKEASAKGYGYEDICVLVRKKKHAVNIAHFLLKEGIPIVSSESLLLSQSNKVTLLINLTEYILQPDQQIFAYKLLEALSTNHKDKHAFITQNLNHVWSYLQTEYQFDPNRYKQLAVYDAMEYAIGVFGLANKPDAYLFSFLDLVFDYSQKQSLDLYGFLEFWKKKGVTLSISMPESISAVNIMTIHKSKGLEFPVVIFPYANTNIYEEINPKLWLKTEPSVYHGFSELLISKQKEVIEYGPIAANNFEEEQNKLQLDAYNVLYVALTRAINALFVISALDLDQKGNFKENNLSGLFIYYLIKVKKWSPDLGVYNFGSLEHKKDVHNKPHEPHEPHFIPYIKSNKQKAIQNLVTKSGMLWGTTQGNAIDQGNKIHYILGLIQFKNDLEFALTKTVAKGIIRLIEVDPTKRMVESVINHPELSPYFEPKNELVYNERDILLQDGSVLRPDRVVINNDQVTIMDFKTGSVDSNYQNQLRHYALAYEDMGYRVTNKIIVYISDVITTEFI